MPPTTPPWGWIGVQGQTSGNRHGIPTWDLEQHQLDLDCPCGPREGECGTIFHNAFDGRERYEAGEAKMH